MKAFRILFLCLLLMPASGVSAQLVDKVLDIFNEDSLRAAPAVKSDSDSIQLSVIQAGTGGGEVE